MVKLREFVNSPPSFLSVLMFVFLFFKNFSQTKFVYYFEKT